MIRRPPRSTQSRSSAASDVYKRQALAITFGHEIGPAGLAIPTEVAVSGSCPQVFKPLVHATRTSIPARRNGRKSTFGARSSSKPAVSYTHLRAHETRHDLVC